MDPTRAWMIIAVSILLVEVVLVLSDEFVEVGYDMFLHKFAENAFASFFGEGMVAEGFDVFGSGGGTCR